MDAAVDKPSPRSDVEAPRSRVRPPRHVVEAAVRTLIEWAGDDPDREGLVDTPSRVARAYERFFAGYRIDPASLLARTFEDAATYDDIVVLRDIRYESHCEHHLMPIIGRAHVAYQPAGRVVGISKLARVVAAFAKRLQNQEALTAQIADCIDATLRPRGVAVVVEGVHLCMTMRGVEQRGATMVTRRFLGTFRSDPGLRREFLAMLSAGPAPP